MAQTLKLLLALTLLRAATVMAQPPDIVITHVTVIDGNGSAPQPDMTVIITGSRIAAVSPAAQQIFPAGAQIVDGRSRFLIPGLWDMHVHLMRPGRPETYFPLYIANGIIGGRDMGGELPLYEIQKINHEVGDGRRLGRRFVAAWPLVDGP